MALKYTPILRELYQKKASMSRAPRRMNSVPLIGSLPLEAMKPFKPFISAIPIPLSKAMDTGLVLLSLMPFGVILKLWQEAYWLTTHGDAWPQWPVLSSTTAPTSILHSQRRYMQIHYGILRGLKKSYLGLSCAADKDWLEYWAAKSRNPDLIYSTYPLLVSSRVHSLEPL